MIDKNIDKILKIFLRRFPETYVERQQLTLAIRKICGENVSQYFIKKIIERLESDGYISVAKESLPHRLSRITVYNVNFRKLKEVYPEEFENQLREYKQTELQKLEGTLAIF